MISITDTSLHADTERALFFYLFMEIDQEIYRPTNCLKDPIVFLNGEGPEGPRKAYR